MTTSPSSERESPSSSNGEFLSSLPRWRQFLSMLNWRRDPDYEQRMRALRIDIERIESEMPQTENETEQIKRDTEQIKRDTEQIRKDTKLIEKDIELIERDTELIEKDIERLRRENARLKAMNASTRQQCFPPASSLSPALSTAADCEPSSP